MGGKGGSMESDNRLVGAIIASLLAVILLRRLLGKKGRSAGTIAGAPLEITLETAAEDGASDDGADIIVVGAGVAGSALAYTLAKVRIPSFVLQLHLLVGSSFLEHGVSLRINLALIVLLTFSFLPKLVGPAEIYYPEGVRCCFYPIYSSLLI